MNVLMVGTSKGSFRMRGIQIGAALGARVKRRPTDADWRWADVVVLVKHAGLEWAHQAHRFHVPIIWDVLDCWRQPEDNAWTVEQGKVFVAGLASRIKPTAMIAATQQMASDIGGVYIPHHCRIGLRPTPPREQVTVVGYDGQKKYLGRWLDAVSAECARRGWRFVINPPNLPDVDILVAFRDGKWDGPLCRAWKSGVKHVNALCAGRPIVTQRVSACEELSRNWTLVEDARQLAGALMVSADSTSRHCAFSDGKARSAQFTVESLVANYYRPLLERVASRVAA